jgi:hypothetical protein
LQCVPQLSHPSREEVGGAKWGGSATPLFPRESHCLRTNPRTINFPSTTSLPLLGKVDCLSLRGVGNLRSREAESDILMGVGGRLIF